MNGHEQNVAIARAFGGVEKDFKANDVDELDGRYWVLFGNVCYGGLPDFRGSLDAIQNVVTKLNASQRGEWLKLLTVIVYRDFMVNPADEAQGWTEIATAAQRAEAVLRVFNRWEPRIGLIAKIDELKSGQWWVWSCLVEQADGSNKAGFVQSDGHMLAFDTIEYE